MGNRKGEWTRRKKEGKEKEEERKRIITSHNLNFLPQAIRVGVYFYFLSLKLTKFQGMSS